MSGACGPRSTPAEEEWTDVAADPSPSFLRLLFIAALLGVWEWAVFYFQTPAYIVPAP